MATVIRPEMSELEILRCVAEFYGSASSYEAYEKDWDGSGRISIITPPVTRDQGAYARHAMQVIKAKQAAAALPKVAGAVS